MYRKAVTERFIEPLNRPADAYVGVELEFPIVNLAKRAVTGEIVQRAVENFARAFDFAELRRDANGAVFFAGDEKTGDSLSFDCSYNTLEWSFGRERDIRVLDARFRTYFAFLQKELAAHRHVLTGMGINPYYKLNRREPVANGRYRMLYHFLSGRPEKGDPFPVHRYPYFGMFSAASQVQMDVDRDNVLDVLALFDRIEPAKALLFANSTWTEQPDILVNRDWLWEYSMHGINQHNVGMWNEPIPSIDALTDYLCSMSMFCAERDGNYLHFAPMPVSEYFAAEQIEGICADERGDRRLFFSPKKEDIAYLRSYKYVDLTWRGTVEFRSACTQPVSDTFAVAAFHAGLMRKLPELRALVDEGEEIYGNGITPKVLRVLMCRRELPPMFDRAALSAFLVRLLDLARDGLYARGYKEESYLSPLYLRAEQMSNPARRLLAGLERGRTVESFIHEYGQLDRRLPNSARREFVCASAIGIEEESLRIRPDGHLADTLHPIPDDPLIDRDFSEAQVEMVTTAGLLPEKTYEAIRRRRGKVVEILHNLKGGRELLWPFSVPPYLGSEEEICVAQ